MVFENLTLFEMHMEGARFGPGGDEDEAEAYEAEDASGGSRIGPIFGFLVLAVGVALAVRRFRGRGDDDGGEESGEITIEAAAEQ